MTWAHFGGSGKVKVRVRFLRFALTMGRKKALLLHEAKEKTEIGFKFFPNAKARNLTTQHFQVLQ